MGRDESWSLEVIGSGDGFCGVGGRVGFVRGLDSGGWILPVVSWRSRFIIRG